MRHHRVRQSELISLPARILLRKHPDFPRPLLPYHAREVAYAKARSRTAHPRPGLPECGAFRRHCEVAHVRQYVARTNGEPVHFRNDRFRQSPDDVHEVLFTRAAVLGAGAVLRLVAP